MKTLLPLLLLFTLSACGTVHHALNVQDEAAFKLGTQVSVGQVSNKTGKSFDVDVEQLMRDALTKHLETEGLLAVQPGGQALKFNVDIINYEKGDAFKRWLWPGYGSTILVVEGNLFDSQGRPAATVQANRSVDAGGGYTIGAWKTVFDNLAADLVADLRARLKAN